MESAVPVASTEVTYLPSTTDFRVVFLPITRNSRSGLLNGPVLNSGDSLFVLLLCEAGS